jgi:hypothetical protein
MVWVLLAVSLGLVASSHSFFVGQWSPDFWLRANSDTPGNVWLEVAAAKVRRCGTYIVTAEVLFSWILYYQFQFGFLGFWFPVLLTISCLGFCCSFLFLLSSAPEFYSMTYVFSLLNVPIWNALWQTSAAVRSWAAVGYRWLAAPSIWF